MSDVIERIKKRIEARKWKITDDAFIPEIIGMQYANNMNDWCLEIIDKELAKEPQEDPNIPLECVDGSCPMALSDEYEERGMDIVHNCEECPYHPQVQLIVRSTEETKQKLMEYFNIGDSSVYYLTRVKEAFSIGTMTLDDFVEFTESDIDDLIDYLTKKEV